MLRLFHSRLKKTSKSRKLREQNLRYTILLSPSAAQLKNNSALPPCSGFR
jgi:hypothetical protein